jgi:hypothetical protein
MTARRDERRFGMKALYTLAEVATVSRPVAPFLAADLEPSYGLAWLSTGPGSLRG